MQQVRSRFRRTLQVSGLIIREAIGWGLLVLGLYFFRVTMNYLNYAAIIEGFICAVIGLVVFRCGLQLVKVSVAARALHAEPSVPLVQVSQDQ